MMTRKEFKKTLISSDCVTFWLSKTKEEVSGLLGEDGVKMSNLISVTHIIAMIYLLIRCTQLRTFGYGYFYHQGIAFYCLSPPSFMILEKYILQRSKKDD